MCKQIESFCCRKNWSWEKNLFFVIKLKKFCFSIAQYFVIDRQTRKKALTFASLSLYSANWVNLLSNKNAKSMPIILSELFVFFLSLDLYFFIDTLLWMKNIAIEYPHNWRRWTRIGINMTIEVNIYPFLNRFQWHRRSS